MDALRFHIDGEVTYQEVARADIFKMVQTNVEQMLKLHNQLSTAPEGPHIERRKSISSDVPCLNMRDIRKLDSIFSISTEPSLTVRRQVILVNADPIRAVILKDNCLVFLPDGADSLISMMKQAFKDTYQGGDDAGANATLDILIKQTQSGELETLRKLKNVVSELESQVNGIRRILFNVLEDEVTLHAFYLTKLFHTPHLGRAENDNWNFDSEYVEAMLESYLQEFYGQQAKIELVLSSIQNTESVVMMKLDAMRNSLLTVELSLTTMTAFVTMSTFVTGGFGMNLNSTIQDMLGIFYVTFGLCFAFPFVMYFLSSRYLRRRGIKLLGGV
ncbi:unnamed protein product [Aphanomyces euteiches]